MTDLTDDYYAAEADRLEHEHHAAAAKARKAEWVRARRDEGMTWPAIGELIGVSPQRAAELAAWERP